MKNSIKIAKTTRVQHQDQSNIIWNADVSKILKTLPDDQYFDLIVTSPPYNIGKSYEEVTSLCRYVEWQRSVIELLIKRLNKNGSLCWQVGNYVQDGEIFPLDYIFYPIFHELGLKLRNRIVWHYGHGHHLQRRFSGRYEVVLWFTKSDEYTFNLDDVRIPPKYPGKRSYKGPRAGQLSSNPLGKNPEDVWEVTDAPHDLWRIPNVKAGHVEKTEHPCQFPVGLVERLILALTNPGDLIFDPFTGTGSAGVAALLHDRRFWGCEIDSEYAKLAYSRMQRTMEGTERFRSHARPIYDHRTSKLSRIPQAAE